MAIASFILSSEQIQQQWDDLAEEEIDWIDQDTHRLIDALTMKYGISRDEAARQVDAFLKANQPQSDE